MFRAWVVLALMAPASAIAASRVAVVEAINPDTVVAEAIVRLRAELTSAGFDVVLAPSNDNTDVRRDLEPSGPEPPPVATLAIRRVEGGTAIDVWVADRVSGKTSVRRVDARASEDMLPSALAIRAVELLRASLLETTLPERAAKQEVPPDVAALVQVREQPEPSRLVGLSVGMLHSFDGLGPAVGPVIHLSADVHSRLAVRFEMVGPVFASSVGAPAGVAAFRQEFATIGFVGTPWSGAFVPHGGLAFGGYHLHARGTAPPPDSGRSDEVWALLGVVGVGFSLRASRGVTIVGELETLVTWPGVGVDLAGSVAGRAGRPSFLASLGPSWSF